MHVKVKINIVVCCQNFVSLTWTFPPISKDFDSQGMAASRAAHFPHILRASRQMTAAARHNDACRRVFCALPPHFSASFFTIPVKKRFIIEELTWNSQTFHAAYGCLFTTEMHRLKECKTELGAIPFLQFNCNSDKSNFPPILTPVPKPVHAINFLRWKFHSIT